MGIPCGSRTAPWLNRAVTAARSPIEFHNLWLLQVRPCYPAGSFSAVKRGLVAIYIRCPYFWNDAFTIVDQC